MSSQVFREQTTGARVVSVCLLLLLLLLLLLIISNPFSRCTLFTYYSVWQEIMHDANVLNFERLLSYHHWRFSWYSFLDLLDIDYVEGFSCPICGSGDEKLDTVVCDATSLSFRQEFCTTLRSSDQPDRRSSTLRGIGR